VLYISRIPSQSTTIKQTLIQAIEDSKRWFNLEKDESTHKRDLAKMIELIKWVLENMNKPDIYVCNPY